VDTAPSTSTGLAQDLKPLQWIQLLLIHGERCRSYPHDDKASLCVQTTKHSQWAQAAVPATHSVSRCRPNLHKHSSMPGQLPSLAKDQRLPAAAGALHGCSHPSSRAAAGKAASCSPSNLRESRHCTLPSSFGSGYCPSAVSAAGW
jgi:hypothetical protein